MTSSLPGPPPAGRHTPGVAVPGPTERVFRLVIVTGQEGAGKSTIVRELLPHTPRGAQIDAVSG